MLIRICLQKVILFFLLMTTACVSPASGALIIDTIGDPSPAIALTSSGIPAHFNATTDVGFLRDTALSAGADSFLASVVGGGSIVEVTVLDGGTGGSLTLNYDGMVANLAPNGESTLVIDFLSIDTRSGSGGSIGLTATANGGSVALPLSTSTTPTSLVIPFASFLPAPTFTAISSLALQFNLSGALTNLAIDRIFTAGPSGEIPEPASLVLIGLAGLSLASIRRQTR